MAAAARSWDQPQAVQGGGGGVQAEFKVVCQCVNEGSLCLKGVATFCCARERNKPKGSGNCERVRESGKLWLALSGTHSQLKKKAKKS